MGWEVGWGGWQIEIGKRKVFTCARIRQHFHSPPKMYGHMCALTGLSLVLTTKWRYLHIHTFTYLHMYVCFNARACWRVFWNFKLLFGLNCFVGQTKRQRHRILYTYAHIYICTHTCVHVFVCLHCCCHAAVTKWTLATQVTQRIGI